MIHSFTNFEEFEAKVKDFGVAEDLHSLKELDFTFFERYGSYVIISIRDSSPEPTNIMVLSENDSFLYSAKPFSEDQLKLFKYTLKKNFGESTVLAYLVFKSVLSSYNAAFEKVNQEIDDQEEKLDPHAVEQLHRSLRKVGDKVEDLVDLLIKLEDREVHEVNTSYVSYDYDVLIAKARHLLDRIKSHMTQVMGLRNEIEIKNTRELNKRIEYLSDVVKKLTAITVIFMIPTIVAGHFGMNIKYFGLVDVNSPLAELLIIGGTLAAMGVLAVYLKWRDWL